MHGALVDALLLAEVYWQLRHHDVSQPDFLEDVEPDTDTNPELHSIPIDRPAIRVIQASDNEMLEHEEVLNQIQKESKGNCLWLKLSEGQ